MQIDPQAKEMQPAPNSELVARPLWEQISQQTGVDGTNFFYGPDSQATPDYERIVAADWTTSVWVSQTYGIGKDNPVNSYSLTDQQKSRALYAMFEGVTSFRARFAVVGCCTTGRNFLLGGYSDVTRPLCPYPPPPSLPPPPSPPMPPPAPPPFPPSLSEANCAEADDQITDLMACHSCQRQGLIDQLAALGFSENGDAAPLSSTSVTVTMAAGWNWVSLNVQPAATGMDLPSMLSYELGWSVGDLIKSGSAFSLWDGSKWSGSLTSWHAEQTHLLKLSSPITFSVTGDLFNSVTVASGWNWIALASATDLSIDAVTHSGGFVQGDLLKSGSTFSMFAGSAFTGSLKTLSVGSGYLLQCANAGTLTFGSSSSLGRRSLQAQLHQPWAEQLNNGDTSASLRVTVAISGAAASPDGTLAAFNSIGDVIGVVTAAEAGIFSLSVTNPKFADASVSDIVTFKFDTGSEVVDLATTYTYLANEIAAVTVSDFEPCGTCSHYMNNPGNVGTAKDSSAYSCVPGDASLSFNAGSAEQAQGSGECYAEVSGKYRQCVRATGSGGDYSYAIRETSGCLEKRPSASKTKRPIAAAAALPAKLKVGDAGHGGPASSTHA